MGKGDVSIADLPAEQIVSIPSGDWHVIFAMFKDRDVPASVAATHLRWHADRVRRWGGAFPSLRTLAGELRWTTSRVHTLVRSLPEITDVVRPGPAPVDLAEVRDGESFVLPTRPHTHGELVSIAVRWLRNSRKCVAAFGEIVTDSQVTPDAIGFLRAPHGRPGWSVYVECKTSRSDFRADKKKPIHTRPESCPGQERWYLTAPGLVRVNEVPPGWGLAEAGHNRVRLLQDAARGEFSASRASEDMGILLSALRRHERGAEWDGPTGRFVREDSSNEEAGEG